MSESKDKTQMFMIVSDADEIFDGQRMRKRAEYGDKENQKSIAAIFDVTKGTFVDALSGLRIGILWDEKMADSFCEALSMMNPGKGFAKLDVSKNLGTLDLDRKAVLSMNKVFSDFGAESFNKLFQRAQGIKNKITKKEGPA